MDFDSNDVLWLVNFTSKLWHVDTNTGARTYAGTWGDFNYAHHGDIDLDTDLYYGISDTYGNIALRVIDLANATKVGDYYALDDNIHTLTFVADNDPKTKDDCKKGGWEGYGFRNQGQCVRFIETGKDSR